MNSQIFIDLLPLKKDGSNGGNAVFILSLINFFQKNYYNEINIICQKSNEEFILSKLDGKIKESNFYQTYNQILTEYGTIPKEPKKAIEIFLSLFLRILSLFLRISSFFERVMGFLDRKFQSQKSSLLIKILRKTITIINKIFLVISQKLIYLIMSFNKKDKKDSLILFSPFSHFDPLSQIFSRKVCIVYDMQHKDFPQFLTTDEKKIRDFHYSNSLNFFDTVITISDFSKERIKKHYPKSSFDSQNDKIKVLHLPYLSIHSEVNISHSDKNFIKGLRLNKQFFYTPANYWEHKNHKSLFIAISMFVKMNKDVSFVFSGKFPNNAVKDEFQKFIRFNNLQEQVFLLNYVSNDNVGVLYRNCIAVIVPSLYEGFGMTLQEAHFKNKMVLASNIRAHKEIADPKTTIFFDARNPTDIFNKITQFFEIDTKNLKFNKKNNPDLVYQRYSDTILGNTN
jgi:glycosyltransferase involved in cell wall biosynthesis